MKDTLHILNKIDNINNRNISSNIVNMFPSIDNVLGLEAVSEILNNRI